MIFLTIDSLRGDKCIGDSKTSKTPNLDKLINNGVYFSQTISSSDQTGTSLASIFTGNLSIKTGLTQVTFTSNVKTFFDLLGNNEYEIYSFVPDTPFFIDLVSKNDKSVHYPFEKKESWVRLHEGLGNQLIEFLNKNDCKSPWFMYIHLMDIRSPFLVPNGFETEEFGKTKYDQLVSSIDLWIGKILEKINFDNTLLVISSDHGEYIPVTGENISEIPKIQKAIRKGTKSVPFLEKAGLKAILNLRFVAQTYKKEILKRTLTPYEMRSFNTRAGIELYDELIKVPLIFFGKNINSQKIITDLVRHVDIFPTILESIGIEKNKETDGRSLMPLMEGKEMEEIPAYIEVGINLAQIIDKKDKRGLAKVIGLRTSDFKYIRSRDDPAKNIRLFDLKNDPDEKTNVADIKTDMVKIMENKLQEIIKSSKVNERKMSDEEIQKAKDVLANLGYL